MGVSKSKQMVETFTKTTNEIMNKTTTNISNQNNMSAVLHQKIDIDLEGANLGNCSLKVVQEGSVTMDVIVDFAAEVGVQMSADLLNKLEEMAKQTLEKTRSGINIPPWSLDISDTVHRSRIEIENKVSNIVETSIKNVVEVSAENNQVIIFKGRNMIMGNCVAGQGINFDQKGQVEVIARSISKNVIDNFMEVKAINDIMRDIQQSEKLEYIGFDANEFANSITGFLSGAIISVIICVICVVLIFYFLFSNTFDKAIENPDAFEKVVGSVAKGINTVSNPAASLMPQYPQPQPQYLQHQPQYVAQSPPFRINGGALSKNTKNIGLGISVFVLIVGIIISIICFYKWNEKKKERDEAKAEVDKKNKEIDELNSYRE
jgi:hypothetical protein